MMEIILLNNTDEFHILFAGNSLYIEYIFKKSTFSISVNLNMSKIVLVYVI